jgi:hypothetical protein
MKELQIVLSDDLTFAETGKRVPADETVFVSIDGKKRELDLTEEHARELREFLEPWIRAGHAPGSAPTKPSKPAAEPKSLMVGRERMAKLRDWVDKNHIRGRSGPDRPAYLTTTGKNYAPDWLLHLYATAMDAEGEHDEWIGKWSRLSGEVVPVPLRKEDVRRG